MALTNVAMWTDNGWKSVTIDEAVDIFPDDKVSANSGIFMCRLCKKYVTLTAPGIYSRCFKHSRGDIDKECDDRALSSPLQNFELHTFIPPMRIKINNSQSYSLEMGFILPPDIKDNRGSIIIRNDNLSISEFKYDISRLSYDKLTYLQIGSVPAEKYTISVSGSSLSLPHIVDGIKKIGVLFDYYTRKKLPDDADVIVNHEYYFLTIKKIYVPSDVIVNQICVMNGWYIYKIRAKVFNRSNADFFFKFGYLLTEKQASLTFLWPEYILSPYVIRHRSDKLNLYIQGESIIPKIYPNGNILCCKYCDSDNGVAVTVECNARQQLLSAGRTRVLRYTYLWKDTLDTCIELPIVRITDIKGFEVIAGESNKLPEKRILQITPQFDGYIEISKDDWIIEKRRINASVVSEIDQIQFGICIRIFQGLECIYSISYLRQNKTVSDDEEELLQQLQSAGGKMLPISHLFGAVTKKYNGYPLIQKWIYSQIRNGCISEKAYKIIRGK
ncbi:hypothetical protein [Ruminococcus flavefaciens]|uniref:hypothetical protein n=1 Tax=Ruminococcus flavefaciens TaxID=1265 RepID=UPI0026F2B801|nr:hypothetical protein [Ruminococcus flavefaciens]